MGPAADPPGPGITEPRDDASTAEPRHPWTSDRRWGVYGTSLLVDAAQRVARDHAGLSRQQIMRRVFSPFPVGGLAWWSDTWGAPRYAGGYHPHHGQDILCNAGTPLLAVSRGTVRLSNDPLGGTTLKLVRQDGSYWYYAHLDRYAKGIDDGSIVREGTILGMCGSSGDATVPHLHFCRFSASGRPEDPMQALVRWLHQAEHRLGVEPSKRRRSPIDTSVAEETDLAQRRQTNGTDHGVAFEASPARSAQASKDPTLPIDAALLLLFLLGPPLRRRLDRSRSRG